MMPQEIGEKITLNKLNKERAIRHEERELRQQKMRMFNSHNVRKSGHTPSLG